MEAYGTDTLTSFEIPPLLALSAVADGTRGRGGGGWGALLSRVHMGVWGQYILFHCQEKVLISPLPSDTLYSKGSLFQGATGLAGPLSLTRVRGGSRVQDFTTTVLFPPGGCELDPRVPLADWGCRRPEPTALPFSEDRRPTKVRKSQRPRTKQGPNTQFLLLLPRVELKAMHQFKPFPPPLLVPCTSQPWPLTQALGSSSSQRQEMKPADSKETYTPWVSLPSAFQPRKCDSLSPEKVKSRPPRPVWPSVSIYGRSGRLTLLPYRGRFLATSRRL